MDRPTVGRTMLTFRCRDMGFDCGFVTTSAHKEDLLRMIAEHGRTAHGIQVITPDVAARVNAVIR